MHKDAFAFNLLYPFEFFKFVRADSCSDITHVRTPRVANRKDPRLILAGGILLSKVASSGGPADFLSLR